MICAHWYWFEFSSSRRRHGVATTRMKTASIATQADKSEVNVQVQLQSLRTSVAAGSRFLARVCRCFCCCCCVAFQQTAGGAGPSAACDSGGVAAATAMPLASAEPKPGGREATQQHPRVKVFNPGDACTPLSSVQVFKWCPHSTTTASRTPHPPCMRGAAAAEFWGGPSAPTADRSLPPGAALLGCWSPSAVRQRAGA